MTTVIDLDRNYRPNEAAEALRCGRSTLYAAVARGDLAQPARTGLRSVVWSGRALRAYLEKLEERERFVPAPNRQRHEQELAAA